MKMKRRSLETRFWKDSYIQSLPAKGKLLFNYLLMNEYVNIIHIYELPENYISLETGLTSKEIQEFKTKFQTMASFYSKTIGSKYVMLINMNIMREKLMKRLKKISLKLYLPILSNILILLSIPPRYPLEGI